MVTFLTPLQCLGQGHSCKFYFSIYFSPGHSLLLLSLDWPWPTLPPKPMKRTFSCLGPMCSRVRRSNEKQMQKGHTHTCSANLLSILLSSTPLHFPSPFFTFHNTFFFSAMRYLSENWALRQNYGMKNLHREASFSTCKSQTANGYEVLSCAPG